MWQGGDDANRRLVQLYSICLGSLVFAYSLFSVQLFLAGQSFGVVDWVLIAARVLFGGAAVGIVLYPRWLAEKLGPEIDTMGATFEARFEDASTTHKLRLIVLVTMLSLLLELVMIRWLASVFPVFSFFKNFTLLACFLGLGAGYAVRSAAHRRWCCPCWRCSSS